MRVFTSTFSFETRGEVDFVDITHHIEEIVRESGIRNGIAVVFAPHATGAIIINENDSSLLEDLRDILGRIIPRHAEYRHPVNAHSHLRSILMEPSKVLPVIGGSLALGTWQSVMWVEVDTHPRTRKVIVTVLGD